MKPGDILDFKLHRQLTSSLMSAIGFENMFCVDMVHNHGGSCFRGWVEEGAIFSVLLRWVWEDGRLALLRWVWEDGRLSHQLI